MNRRIIVIAALVVLGIVLFATRGFGLLAQGEGDGLTLYGNVDIREVDMAFRVPGRIEQIPVDEGDRVAAGDLLAVLDATPVEDTIGEAEARIAEARAGLAALENGNRPQDVAQARARLDAARAQAASARRDYARREGLVESGAISRDLWDTTVADLRQAEAREKEAAAAFSLSQSGARAEDIAAARARLGAAEAARKSARTNLSDTRLVAATDGTIITRVAEPGSLVQPGEPVVTIAIDRPVRVRAYVAEPDLTRIGPGMAVEVRVDGRAEPYRGTIGHISAQAEFTPKSVQTEDLRTDLVYRLRIVVDNPDDGLRQGQPVSVEVPGARPATGD